MSLVDSEKTYAEGERTDTRSATEKAVVNKVIRAIIPLSVIGLFASFIDRTNIAIAGPEMAEPLGLTPTMFGLAAGLFFVGYVLFEIPSNFALKKFGARVWIARIMLTWGAVCVGMAFVQGATSLYIMRFLLGVAEAGFYPGILFYISLFVPKKDLTRAYSMFQLGIPISLAIGSVFTSSLLYMHNVFGLDGWQWVFIIEGGLTILLGILWFFASSDEPASAKFLTNSDKSTLTAILKRERGSSDKDDHSASAIGDILKSRRAWLFAFVYVFMMVGFYSVTYWAPQIIKLRMGLTNAEAGLMSAIPWVFAALSLFLASKLVSKTGKRVSLLIGILAFCGVGMLISSLTSNSYIALIGLCMGACIQAAVPLIYAITSHEFDGTKNAVALAFVNSFGNIGGFLGPYLLGVLRDGSGNDIGGLLLLSSSFFVAGLLSIRLFKVERHHRLTH